MFIAQLLNLYRCIVLSLILCAVITGPLRAQIRASNFKVPYRPSSGRQDAQGVGLQTIENDLVRVGINTNYGGAITYLAFKDSHNGQVRTDNMVNNPDLGRQIQIGLYGGPTDYSKNGSPAWTGLGWNPIQAGDVYNNPSQVLTVEKQTNLLYVKTIPKQFGLNNEPGEATIEQWIRLDGNVVKVHAKVVMFRSDKTQYEARQQEMPCAYLNGDYHNMWYYRGSQPFTYGNLDRIRPPTDFGDVFPTEPWMASTNDRGYGMGMYIKNNYEWKKGYFGTDLAGDEFSGDASYIAATNFLLLDYNLVHEWDYELIVGHLNDIRAHIYTQPRPLAGPNFRFDVSRKGWHYNKTQDSGWPILGKLHVILTDAKVNKAISPFGFWKGSNNPKLYVRAAFNTQNDKFRLQWRRTEDVTMLPRDDRRMVFPIINDGQFHTYEIDLSQNQDWLNYDIGQIQFETIAEGPAINGWAEFEWVSTDQNGPLAENSTPPFDPPIAGGPTEVICIPGCVPVLSQKLRYIPANRKL